MKVNIYSVLVFFMVGLSLGTGFTKYVEKAKRVELIEKVTTFAALSMMKQYIELQLGERQDLSLDEIRKETVKLYK